MSNMINKALVLTAAASLGMVATASHAEGNPYRAGDMHNHNTCTDGSVSVGYAIDRSVGQGTAGTGGNNFNLDWFTQGNHGGSGNRDCRFSDPTQTNSATSQLPASEIGTAVDANGKPRATLWTDTFGKTIQGTTVNSLLGTPNGNNMWRWQNIQQVEYPIITARGLQYGRKTLVEGLELVIPGHEHVDVAILEGQNTRQGKGNADAMAKFEFLFDRSDRDVIGPLAADGSKVWTGKDDVSNNCAAPDGGTRGHAKAVVAMKYLQANYPLTSYAVPTHTERHGPFNPANCNGGFNIESYRDFNNAAPTVAFGIESPGHAAQGTANGVNGAGSYSAGEAVGDGTYGLVGVYNAKVGGLWDAMLAEGRNFFMFISSDWHNRGVFGSGDAASTGDFIPGEFSHLYVPGQEEFGPQSIIDGMRSGKSYSVLGGLIGPDLVFRAKTERGGWKTMGETLVVKPGDKITVEMTLSVPAKNNSPYSFNNPLLAQNGISQPLNQPSLDHVDLIAGDITGIVAPTDPAYAPSPAAIKAANYAYVDAKQMHVKQVLAKSMKAEEQEDGQGGKRYTFRTVYTATDKPFYIRARGTNMPNATPNVTDMNGNPLLDLNNALVPCLDKACPAHLDKNKAGQPVVTYDVQAWSNLWFYANPIFVRPAGTPQLMVEKAHAQAAQIARQSDDKVGMR